MDWGLIFCTTGRLPGLTVSQEVWYPGLSSSRVVTCCDHWPFLHQTSRPGSPGHPLQPVSILHSDLAPLSFSRFTLEDTCYSALYCKTQVAHLLSHSLNIGQKLETKYLLLTKEEFHIPYNTKLVIIIIRRYSYSSRSGVSLTGGNQVNPK